MQDHAQIGIAREGVPRCGCANFHQRVTAALLARFDDGFPQVVDAGIFRLNDGACGEEWREPRDAEFGKFLDQEVAAIPLRHRASHLEREAEFAIDDARFADDQPNRLLAQRDDFRRIFAAIAVEQHDRIANGPTSHCRQMMRLRTRQRILAGSQNVVGVESVGHARNCRSGFRR